MRVLPPLHQKRRKSMLKPVAIITSLEDSPPTIDRSLLGAYLQTVYRVNDPPGFAFFPGKHLPAEAADWLFRRRVGSWAFLTAWNPRSAVLSAVENRRRNKQLSGALQNGGWPYYSGVGIGAGETWSPEESFWILDIPAERAIQLGRQFDQNALVWWTEGKPVELWWL